MTMLLTIDGRSYEVDAPAHDRLSTVLRRDLGMKHVHVSCAEGECGACTILVDGMPTTSCLMLARQAEGRSITTLDGLGGPGLLHAIQEAFIEEQSFQCAFCTPGFIMMTAAFLTENSSPTPEEAAIGVSGNICRCGAHPFIVRGVLTAAEKLRGANTIGRSPYAVITANDNGRRSERR